MTWASGRAVSMTDEEFILIRDLIYDHCGIFLPENVKYLVERRLRPRLPAHEISSFRDYYRLLKYGRHNLREMDEITERVTTNETYFFRGETQLKAFSEEIIPEVLDSRRPESPIRIWSAGCSSGEEPYTLAMMLQDIPALNGRRVQIYGNDISRKVIASAREGTYRDMSFRQTPSDVVARHFEPAGKLMRINEDIRNSVQFGQINLMDTKSMGFLADIDVVFCRNVMIYFSPESREKVLKTLYSKLRPGGYLILGHSESLMNVSTDFELCPLTHDIVYRRPLLG